MFRAVPEPDDARRKPQAAAARRQKRRRVREALGLVVIRVEVDAHALNAALTGAGMVRTRDRASLEAAVAQIVCEWIAQHRHA